MPDQAEDLRRLVALGEKVTGLPRSELAAMMEQSGLGTVPELDDDGTTHDPIPKLTDDLITYRRLWLDQKADLERWKSVGGFDMPENLTSENLAAMWEMMQRREEQSR